MAHYEHSVNIHADPEKVWRVVGDFFGLAGWHPAIESCVVGEEPTIRVVDLGNNMVVRERELSRDDNARTYTYEHVDLLLPVSEFIGRFSVTSDNNDNGCTVTWAAEFIPEGVPEEAVINIASDVFEAGLQGLASSFR